MDDASPASIDRDYALSRRGFAGVAAVVGIAGATRALAETPVVETDVRVKTADGQCDAALFHPAGKGKWPAAIIFTDILGLRPAFREMGKRLAAQGYTVLVPNPFYRTRKAPVLSGPFDFTKPEDRAKLTELTAPLSQATAARDGDAYIAFLDALPQVNTKKKLGVSGYCMGGPFTMITAANHPDRVGAGGSFHGGGVATDQPNSPHLLVPKMKASFYFGIAANDDAKQPNQKDLLRAAYDGAHLPAKIEVYAGCNHGWCVADGAVYNHDGAERAWAELTALYAKALA